MKFDDQLIAEFQNFDHSKFTVNFTPPRVFLCGGEVDVKAPIPKSARQRLIDYFSRHEQELHDACIQAEDFKDYFKEGAYSDLLEFETDIANIATLIVVCLESPGALVELGLFCTDSVIVKKLLVVAPQEELAGEDSFIYLGPLKNIKRKDADAVIAYPWPKQDVPDYEHIPEIASDIKRRLSKMLKSQQFSAANSAHVALLIHDIVLLAHPITFTEIELALLAFNVDISSADVSRLLYLLEKIELISRTTYSSVNYYYDVSGGSRRVRFGLDSKGRARDTPAIVMGFRRTYFVSEDEQSRKRSLALKQINKLKGGEK